MGPSLIRARNTLSTRALGMALAALIAAALFIPSPPVARGAFKGRNGRIVDTARTGDTDIYSYRPEGGGVKNLTDNARSDQDASWSPNGQRLIYESSVDGNYEIFEMRATGSHKDRLTHTPNIAELEPQYNRNAERIVFFGSVGMESDWELFKMRANGNDLVRLTDNNKDEYGAVWAPDNKHIWFVKDIAGDSEIMVMRADGSHVRRFTDNDRDDNAIDFAPNGKQILMGVKKNGNEDLYKMTAQGKHVTRLTNNPAEDDMASWSPEGDKIVFVRYVDGMGSRLMVMRANGSNEHPITPFGEHYRPDWQPR